MKRIRYLLLILMSTFFIKAEAGDTLPMSQVYNFSIGDTFDYEIYNSYTQGGFYGAPSSTNTEISYKR